MEDDGDLALISSLGVGVLSNDEYASKCAREVRKAEVDLQELRRKSMAQISQCWAQCHLAREEARRKQEKELVFGMVEKELSKFRNEMRQKEKNEESRIRSLYSTLLSEQDPTDVAPYTQGKETFVEVDGHPTIIHSVVRFPPVPEAYEVPTSTHIWENSCDLLKPPESTRNTSTESLSMIGMALNTDATVPDKEYDEITRMLHRNEEKLAKLTALRV